MKSNQRAYMRRLERREKLLNAAYDVLLKKGVAATTVSAITDYANVSKGSFYLYFDSKEDIIAALWSRFVERFSDRAREIVELAPTLGWWGVADHLVTGLIDYDIEHREMHRILAVASRANAVKQFAEADGVLIDFIVATIQRGVHAGEFHSIDPPLTAQFIYHGTDQILLNAALAGENVDRDRLVSTITRLIHKVLSP